MRVQKNFCLVLCLCMMFLAMIDPAEAQTTLIGELLKRAFDDETESFQISITTEEVTGDFTIGGTLTAGDATLDGDLTFENGETLSNSVNGVLNAGAADLTTTGTLTAGDAALNGDLTLENDETISNSVNGTIAVTAATTTFSGDVGITGELTWGGDLIYAFEDVDAESYTLQAGDKILGVSYSATGATSIIIPTLQVVEGRLIIVKDTGGNADPNTITVSTEGSEKIDGADTKTITSDYGVLRLLCNGSHCFTW